MLKDWWKYLILGYQCYPKQSKIICKFYAISIITQAMYFFFFRKTKTRQNSQRMGNSKYNFSKKFICILCIWLFCLHVCVCTKCMQCAERTEEGIWSPGTGVSIRCELPWGLGTEFRSSIRASAFIHRALSPVQLIWSYEESKPIVL